MLLVKICGITTLEDAQMAIEAGADALGFNFWRPGKRYVAPEAAARIAAQLPARIMKVGVFVDEDAAEVHKIADAAGLGCVQLHGRETPEYAQALAACGGRVWKALRVDERFQPAALAAYSVDAFLLDGAGAAPGGNAATFDWQRAREARVFGRVILAGGLNPDNVAEAVRSVEPWGVDVASGVESAPGRKDAALVRRFIEAVRAVQRL